MNMVKIIPLKKVLTQNKVGLGMENNSSQWAKPSFALHEDLVICFLN